MLSPLTVEDLTADLVWPRLLRTGPLALRPARIGLGFIYLLCCAIVLLVAGALLRDGGRAEVGGLLGQQLLVNPASFLEAVSRLDARAAAQEVYLSFVTVPAQIVRAAPLVAVPTFLLLVLLTAVFGGAISRSVATETAAGVNLSWPQALGFGVKRAASLAGSVLLPLGVIWGLALGLMLAGGVLFSASGINVLGAVLFPLLIVGGLIGAVACLVFIVAHPMLIPAVACEGTDAIDAVQHAYSFATSRPLRLVVYLAILIVQLAVIVLVAGLVVALALKFAQGGVLGFRTTASIEVARSMLWVGEDGAREALRGSNKAAAGIVNLFLLIVLGLLGGFVVSMIFTGSTLLYMAMRRVVDGQDFSEVWMPTMVPGTQAKKSGPAQSAGETDSVSDTGPADET